MRIGASPTYPAPARSRVLVLLLSVLFLGPLVAPLFQATGLVPFAALGGLARDVLATYVCPTPAKSYLLLGWPMAVCARCWGATIGLWAAYLLLQTPAARIVTRLSWALRLALAVLAFLLWPLEIYGEAWGWWYAPYWLLLLNGACFGLLGGLALLPRLPKS
jgi:hypothetical protein